MKNLLKKEMKLSSSPLSYIFILFGLAAFLPGYPILIGSFFLCLGLFQSFQTMREANDITYSSLLPVSKSDIVKVKYLFCVIIEMCFFAVTSIPVIIRLTILSDIAVYRQNALMNANLVYLCYTLIILGFFNLIFVGGFFKTAYNFGKPFLEFIFSAFCVIAAGETLFHIPALSALNSFGFDNIGVQFSALVSGIIIYIILTVFSLSRSITNFDRIDI